MTMDQLLAEKAKVKSKLKEYDACYEGIFNKLPTRHEKEVMKPLYICFIVKILSILRHLFLMS